MEGKEDYKKVIEAALFMSPGAMGINDMASIAGIASLSYVEELIKELGEDYKKRDTSLEIVEIDKKFMLSVKEPYAGKVSKLAGGPDLGRGALRILAYISKNNNALQSEIVKAFGESTYEYVKELRDKEFIDAKKEGRSKRISVTNKFKEYFNVSS